ncbi:hypothetical protein H3Z74_02130 [Sphingomonas alpina]|uniref:Calcium-binding protein n=1 Tax=Sphingomonas alpina TaxID=653931 RepID=A0A7H0LK68_9SPHN|nr:calcium-binding protein [Sphingomonas alpina]QNQ10071.1 hypothetical protein H3Z74_02130 [Sphingomonas alpina]
MSVYNGTPGDDVYTGGSDDDQISGNDGKDVLAGGDGADTINGGAGDDILYSSVISPAWKAPLNGTNPGYVRPVLDTGSAVDNLDGGGGYDTIYAGYGDNVYGGLEYSNLLISFQGASAGVTVDFRGLTSGGAITVGGGTIRYISSVLWIDGSEFGDTIIGGDLYSNVKSPIFGLGGDDHITAGTGTGDIYGGEGNDTLDDAGEGHYLYGEAGDDIINAVSTSSVSFGGDGDDTLTVSGRLSYGGAGNDTITIVDRGTDTSAYGQDGDDILDGGAGGTFSRAARAPTGSTAMTAMITSIPITMTLSQPARRTSGLNMISCPAGMATIICRSVMATMPMAAPGGTRWGCRWPARRAG